MLEQYLKPNVSKHGGYREIGDAIWLRPKQQKVTIGEEKLTYVNNPVNGGPTVFDINEFKKQDAKFKKGEINRFERSMAGWTSEYQPKWQTVLEKEVAAEREGKTFSAVSVAGLIEPTDFNTLKSTQRVVAVFTKIEEIHNLLDTVRVMNIDDLNGIAVYDINSLDVDPIQRSGTHNIPYEVSAPGITKTILEPYKYAWRYSLSDELGLVNFDLPNLEDLVLEQITGKLDIRRNKDVAALINATGNSGSQANWKTLNTGENRYVNTASDDIKELLKLVNLEGYGPAEFFGMHPDVWEAFFQNANATTPTGLQTMVQTPISYDNSFRRADGLFPGVRFVLDSLLTTNRIYAWRRDAIFHIFGGVRAVQFENREIGYSGTTFRTYFNSAKMRASLIKGGTGVIA